MNPSDVQLDPRAIQRELDRADVQYRAHYFRQITRLIREAWEGRDGRWRGLECNPAGVLSQPMGRRALEILADDEISEIGVRLAAGERPFRIGSEMRIPYQVIYFIYKWRNRQVERARRQGMSVRERFDGLAEKALVQMEVKAKNREFLKGLSIAEYQTWLKTCREQSDKLREYEQQGQGMTMKIVTQMPILKDGEDPAELEGVLDRRTVLGLVEGEEDAKAPK